jgi:hypothetical protein
MRLLSFECGTILPPVATKGRHTTIEAAARLLELAARDEAEGLGDAPWPPHFAKQRGEPKHVQPGRARKR